MTVGIPFSRWGASPYIVTPVAFRLPEPERISGDRSTEPVSREPVHPFHLALTWQEQIEKDRGLNFAKIATREGLSRARVTQIMNLLGLPDQIQQMLRHPVPGFELAAFSERRLRTLLSRKGRQSAEGILVSEVI